MTYVTINKKKYRLFKFQEALAQIIARGIYAGYVYIIPLQAGLGKRIIMQRVADLMNPRVWFKTKHLK